MITLLARKFIPDYKNTSSASVRLSYGVLCGTVGIFLNILLFAGKITAGVISGSVAIIADALNNLSDAGSSVIMLVGFKLAGQKPDSKHPYGHGRLEYVTGLIVSGLIILMGVELIKSSVEKIMKPSNVTFSLMVMIILAASVLVKGYMYFYNKQIGKKTSSVTMNAVAMDSCSDMAATVLVIISMVAYRFAGLRLDGWMGLAVSGFILYSGIMSAKDTIDTLLGASPDPEFVSSIEKFVLQNEGIVGIHDLIVHDYGPGRMMISLHAEVPANCDVMELHDTIDNIESQIQKTLGAHAVIHMDPVVVDDDRINKMKKITSLLVKKVDERLLIHDFRMVAGPTHTNLIFDVLMPYEIDMTEDELKEKIEQKVAEIPGKHFAVIHIDRPFC